MRYRVSLICVALACSPLLLAVGASEAAGAIIRPTNFGLGADAEVRESQAAINFGSNTELGSSVRNDFPTADVNDPNDRNGVMYLQFDLAGIAAGDAVGAVLRMTFRNSNLSVSRISDVDNVDPNYGRNGIEYYGIPNYQFAEGALTYSTAKGLTADLNVGTKDFDSNAVPLGSRDFPLIGTQNRLAVGDPLDFSSGVLDAFLQGELAAGRATAVIAATHRNAGLASEPNSWRNFNYLFNPKDQTTLGLDAAYDSDVTDPFNTTGAPLGGASNADGRFSPQLRLGVPEPGTAVLGLAAAMAMGWRQRRSAMATR